MKQKWFALAGAFVLAIALAACGGGGDDGDGGGGGGEGAAGKPVLGGTLTFAMARDMTTFDTLKAQDVYSSLVLAQIVESLFDVDNDGKIVGGLVEKSDNPSPEVYVWTLRKGVKFTDGSDFNAEVVKWNLERHINTASSVRNQDVKDITKIETPDPYTVRITLKSAFRPFLSKFNTGAGYMLNPKAVEALGDRIASDAKDLGTGPFKFVQWQKDTQVVVEKNPNYWKKDSSGTQLPYLDRIVFKPFPDENVRLTNVKTGEVDGLIGNPPYKDMASLRTTADLVVKEIPGLGFSFMHMNASKEPFTNPAVRRAISYAIDRAQIRKTVFFDNGKVLDELIPEGLAFWYPKDAAYHPFLKQDLTKAKAELAAGGKPNGFKFAVQISNASPELQQTAELIKDQLKQIGVDMEIQLLEFAKVVENGNTGEYEAHMLGWSGGIDPDGNGYSLFYTKAGFNLSKISDTEIDRQLDLGRTTIDQEKAKEVYAQFVKRWLELQPMLVYFNPPQISTVNKKVQNYPQNYNGYWGAADYYKVWKSN
jgi:peptide/nickel transport system substrate-binding protein